MRLWNRTKKNKSRGQATTELAICATLIIAVFAAMLQYGQTMNFQQQSQMKAFRQALKYSRDKKREVSYTIIKDKRSVNPFSFFGVPEENRMMAGATAAWIKSDIKFTGSLGANKADKVEDYYELNGDIKKLDPIRVEVTFRQKLIFPVTNKVKFWMPIMVLEPQYRKERGVDASMERGETHGGITTQRSYSVSRDIQTKLLMYDREDMEREILNSFTEDQSRREKVMIDSGDFVKELIMDILQIWALSLLDVFDIPGAENMTEAEWIKKVEDNLTSFKWKKAVLNTAGMLLWSVLGGYMLGSDPEVVDVEIIEGYRQYENWGEQDTWSGGSSWQAPL